MNEELDMIAESMDLLWSQTSTLKTLGLRVEELTTVTDALSAKARKPLVKVLPSGPWFATGV